uniref:Uncharacterized protein n=1 Tax=Anguilla anguilla TaxID=7936 RepID=A0A0E9PN52_ANGAN
MCLRERQSPTTSMFSVQTNLTKDLK